MTCFLAAEQIVEEYVVGEARLASYALRGNLPMRVHDGRPMYDASVVARLFRRRDAAEAVGMGLGAFRLGDVLEAPPARSEREPPLRSKRVACEALPPPGAHSA